MKASPVPLLLPALALLATSAVSIGSRAGDLDSLFDRAGPEVRYHVVALRSLGGTSSLATSIDNLGRVAGRSNLPGNQSRHATTWRDGTITDLGTLGGPNSAALWPQTNLRGIVSGIAQTAERDPTNEPWSCSFFFPAANATGYRCLGFRWQDGRMGALPTLGGKNGYATGTNNLGQTAGWAQNTTIDPTCITPNAQQFRAVVWGPSGAVTRELKPLGTDSTSAATGLNDRGQVIGISGICDQAVGRFSARRAVFWDNGVATPIDTFGGVAWNTPTAINERGDVVGFANASAADGGEFNPRAFFWRKGQGARPLGALPGHLTTQANGLSNLRLVVGQSCDAEGACRAVLWRGCEVTDLNAVMEAASSALVLTSANDIDDLGRITGQAFDSASGQFVAYVATPIRP